MPHGGLGHLPMLCALSRHVQNHRSDIFNRILDFKFLFRSFLPGGQNLFLRGQIRLIVLNCHTVSVMVDTLLSDAPVCPSDKVVVRGVSDCFRQCHSRHTAIKFPSLY